MIRVVTDSSCDLPPALIAALPVEIVPLRIAWDGDDLADRHELTPAEFWARLRAATTIPQTAAPSVGAFAAAYRAAARQGSEGVVAVTMSSALSATHAAAAAAAKEVEQPPVRVIDSGQVTMGLGFAVLAGAEQAAAGGTSDDVAAAIEAVLPRLRTIAALDTLQYLQRGGRLGGAAALVGGLLDVKPLITIRGGEVAPAGRVRTRRKALARLEASLDEWGTPSRLAVIHGDAPDADDLAQHLAAAYPEVTPVVTPLGPVVGAHVGPDLIGVVALLR